MFLSQEKEHGPVDTRKFLNVVLGLLGAGTQNKGEKKESVASLCESVQRRLKQEIAALPREGWWEWLKSALVHIKNNIQSFFFGASAAPIRNLAIGTAFLYLLGAPVVYTQLLREQRYLEDNESERKHQVKIKMLLAEQELHKTKGLEAKASSWWLGGADVLLASGEASGRWLEAFGHGLIAPTLNAGADFISRVLSVGLGGLLVKFGTAVSLPFLSFGISLAAVLVGGGYLVYRLGQASDTPAGKVVKKNIKLGAKAAAILSAVV